MSSSQSDQGSADTIITSRLQGGDDSEARVVATFTSHQPVSRGAKFAAARVPR